MFQKVQRIIDTFMKYGGNTVKNEIPIITFRHSSSLSE